MFRGIFHDSIEMDFASVGADPTTVDADEWTERARTLFLRFGPTQPSTSNHRHELHGETVRMAAAMQAEHFPADPEVDVLGIGDGLDPVVGGVGVVAEYLVHQAGNLLHGLLAY